MEGFNELLKKTYNFLSIRIRSEKEIRDYLQKKISDPKNKIQLNPSLIDLIIDKLKEQKFLDDREFVRAWIENRNKIKPKSLKLLKLELVRKGVDKQLIEDVLQNPDFEIITDLEKALMLGKKRMARYKNEDPKKALEKLTRFLASKGFDWDTIKKVIDRIFTKGYNI